MMADLEMIELEAASLTGSNPAAEEALSENMRRAFRNCRRNCAIPASPQAKAVAFTLACGHLAEAAARECLPIGITVELLADLACANRWFGRSEAEIEGIIADAIAAAAQERRVAA